MAKSSLPLSQVYRLLEPGPVVLVTTARQGAPNVVRHTEGHAGVRDRHPDGRAREEGRGMRQCFRPQRRQVRPLRPDARARRAGGGTLGRGVLREPRMQGRRGEVGAEAFRHAWARTPRRLDGGGALPGLSPSLWLTFRAHFCPRSVAIEFPSARHVRCIAGFVHLRLHESEQVGRRRSARQLSTVGDGGDRGRDMRRDVADVLERRIEASLF